MSEGQLKIVHKALNKCRKQRAIVEIYLSFKKSISPQRMTGLNFRPEAPE